MSAKRKTRQVDQAFLLRIRRIAEVKELVLPLIEIDEVTRGFILKRAPKVASMLIRKGPGRNGNNLVNLNSLLSSGLKLRSRDAKGRTLLATATKAKNGLAQEAIRSRRVQHTPQLNDLEAKWQERKVQTETLVQI